MGLAWEASPMFEGVPPSIAQPMAHTGKEQGDQAQAWMFLG